MRLHSSGPRNETPSSKAIHEKTFDRVLEMGKHLSGTIVAVALDVTDFAIAFVVAIGAGAHVGAGTHFGRAAVIRWQS